MASWHLELDPEIAAQSAAAIAQCDGLPVMDRSVQRVLALTEDEQCELGNLVIALESDPALAVNLLRYANSAYVGRPIQAKTVRQAVVMIGRQATRQLCLEAVTFRFFESAPGNGRMSLGQMHLHAVAVGRVAAATAAMISIPTDIPHLAGLLHDCGKLVMPLAFGEEATDELAAVHPSGALRSEAEWDRFGVDHAYAGALFAEQSGLASEIVAAIALHHGGRRGRIAPSPEIGYLQLANTIVGMLAGELPDEELMNDLLTSLELSPDALDELAEAVGPRAMGQNGAALGDRVAELERLASTDELTGLANRRHWMATIRQKMESGSSGNVLLCDLDRFKQVNDTHGHSAGDIVLMEVSRILQRHGVAGRIGGDEFALWVAGDTPVEVADRIVAEVSAAFEKQDELGVGISVGVAPTLQDLSDALEAADRALYKAKAAGRGRVQLYDEPREQQLVA